MNIAQYIIDLAAQGDKQVVSRINAVQGSLDSADRSASRLSTRIRKGLGDAFRSLPGAEFITNPIVAITAGVGVVSKMGMEAEKTATSFNVLVGSEEKAAKMLGEINKYADNTLWDRSTTQDAVKTMLGLTVPAEEVVDDLKMLGDVAMGDKNKLSQLALVFGQISSQGRLMTQDFNQLVNAGYNPLKDISALTGKSVAKLKDEMSKGAISADMLRKALQRATGEGGLYHDSVNQIAQTSFGAFQVLKGKLVQTLLELYNVIQPFVIPVLNALGKGLDYLSKVATWASEHLNILIPVFKYLGIAIAGYMVATNLASIATKGLTLVFKGLLALTSISPFGIIVAGLAAATAAVIACWNKFAGFRAVILTVWDTIKGFGGILKQYILDRILGITAGIGHLGQAIGKLFKGDFSGAWEAAKTGAKEFTGITATQNAFTSTRDLANGVSGRYSSFLDAERQKQAAKDAISSPKAAGGTGAGASTSPVAGGASSGASASSTANAITTGGTRNTSIVLNIGKFFEDININNTSGQDFRAIRDAVLESVNRSLEIAVSAAR